MNCRSVAVRVGNEALQLFARTLAERTWSNAGAERDAALDGDHDEECYIMFVDGKPERVRPHLGVLPAARGEKLADDGQVPQLDLQLFVGFVDRDGGGFASPLNLG